MYALVLWKGSQETSVIPYDQIKKVNGKLLAKWGSSLYSVDLIKSNENKEWLESLEVTTDGKIITPARRSSVSSELLFKKRVHRKKEKAIKTAKDEEAVKTNNRIINKSPIFNDDLPKQAHRKKKPISSPQVSKSDSESDSQDSDKIYDSDSDNKENSNDYNNKSINKHQAEVDRENINEKLREKSEGELKKGDCFCSQLSISVDDIEKLELILEVAKEIHFKETKCNTDKRAKIREQVEENQPVREPVWKGDVKMELFKDAGIIVDDYKVRNIQDIYKKNPREMVRQLMKLIIGEEELRRSSPTGKNGWTPIPTNVFETVERFINESAARKKYTISHKNYREVLTAMCATLRSAKAVVKKEDQRTGIKNENDQIQGEKQIEEENSEEVESDDSQQEANFSMKLNVDETQENKSRKRKIENNEKFKNGGKNLKKKSK